MEVWRHAMGGAAFGVAKPEQPKKYEVIRKTYT
jgi:hypothetical protein